MKTRSGVSVKAQEVPVVIDKCALRLFWNGKRVQSHKLTKNQAKAFLTCARFLCLYLPVAYKLKRPEKRNKR